MGLSLSSVAEVPEVVEVVEVAAAATVAIVAFVIFAYGIGSFLLMRRHVGAREARRALREFFRELWIVGLTQPVLPLFYLVGHRMDAFFARRGREGIAKPARVERSAPADAQAIPTAEAAGRTGEVPIVFVHGYMQNRVGFLGMARTLARRGAGPMFGFNYPWFASITSNAKRLDRFVERICKETGATAVDLVCHSMGGLVALEMMREGALRDTLKVRRCVTIATPHAGVMWRGPLLGVGAAALRRGSALLAAHAGAKLAVPTLSVYSSHDNVVHPKESASLALRGGRDVEVEGLAHLAILFSPKVAEHVAAFLDAPDPL